MSAAGITLAGRRAAERLMVETCTIGRQSGLTTDQTTGKVTPAYEQVYSGPCKVQTFTNREIFKDGGEHQFIVQRYELEIPFSATGVRTGDVATITSSQLDPDMPGRQYRVAALLNKSFATARRLSVEELTG